MPENPENERVEVNQLERQIEELSRLVPSDNTADELERLRRRLEKLRKEIYSKLTPWQRVQMARHSQRPVVPEFIDFIFQDFVELHGDRRFEDDPAMVGGMARFHGEPCMVIGTHKGKDTKEKLQRNFGMPKPEGYRKALRLMKLAEKFSRPLFTFIDTAGAYPGIGAEERGQAEAIACNLREMARLQVPIIVTITGEGGSGGALGIGVGDKVAMMQHAFYSVISPEGCAAILWKTAERRKHAAEALKLTAPELLKLGLIDEIIPEPLGGAHRDPDAAASNLEKFLVESLDEFKRMHVERLVRRRQERITRWGTFYESPSEGARPAPSLAGRTVSQTRRGAPRTARMAARLATVKAGAD